MITVYSKPGCPKCRVLKMKLDKKGIEYDDFQDVDKMMKMGLLSLPILCVDGKMIKFEDAVKYVNEL